MGCKMNWWDKYPHRLQNEIQMIEQKFPQFQLGEAMDNKDYHGWPVAMMGQRYWFGKLRTVSGNKYSVLIVYPFHYPSGEIKTYIIDPYITSTDHRYGDGHLCLYSNGHGGRGQGAGRSMTAVSYIAWVGAWIHAYEIFDKTGKWPENNFFDR